MENERAAPESRVVILGASNKEDRYSFKAFNFLREREFVPVPVHPRIREVGGVTVFPSLDDPGIREGGPVDTVTLYVNPAVVEENVAAIIALKPRRVIMNPGTESESARDALEAAGILVLEACTLVMLRTNQF